MGMYRTIEAYGAENMKWKSDASLILFDRYVKDDENALVTLKEYQEYCEDNGFDPADGDSKSAFIDDYENETYCWGGYEGFLTDVINLEKFDGEITFQAEYSCIYVEKYIPRRNDPHPVTVEDIAEILTEYLNPLLEEPVTIDWLQWSEAE